MGYEAACLWLLTLSSEDGKEDTAPRWAHLSCGRRDYEAN